ncbi:membrane protein YqaA, SNARE-associated domain [Loktanella fryxellensis]|uniref:Membrane protein YqaA, SNARE-associated domain n=1 Tax=Loktanella fryxellensis TaxID=245187 RepID=A0A1H8JYT5_9RHOB|nr:YqaA family protein [Loktanella fryxellensis]SEN85909.1 membrane protein YqaA, SNARE-associated domain [Loktanella fryxellensis]
MTALVALFAVALLAATILPAQSEALLIALLLRGELSPALLIAVATAGNVAGAVVNWGLGRMVVQFRDRRWFPVSAASLARAEDRYRRWGRWSLLASWVPVIGDPLTVVAGVLREPLLPFVVLVTLAKGGRYVVLAAATGVLA